MELLKKGKSHIPCFDWCGKKKKTFSKMWDSFYWFVVISKLWFAFSSEVCFYESQQSCLHWGAVETSPESQLLSLLLHTETQRSVLRQILPVREQILKKVVLSTAGRAAETDVRPHFTSAVVSSHSHTGWHRGVFTEASIKSGCWSPSVSYVGSGCVR